MLTAKPEERELWERYCRDAGRSDSLVVVTLGGPWRFNFLDYELRRPGAGAGLTENLVQLFTAVLEVASRGSAGSAGRGDDGYWRGALAQLLRNAIDAVVLGTGRVSLPDLHRVITSAAQSADEVRSPEWQAASFNYQCLEQADHRGLSAQQRSDLDHTAGYWLREYPSLAEKTRSIVVSTFTTMADGFLRGPLRPLFCTDTTLVPEVTRDGAVIVLDLPIKEFHEVGQFAQVLFKFIWQRAMERGLGGNEAPARPVFLWADEAQFFVGSKDPQFQSTARSALVCTVYLTQNLPSYYAAVGGPESRSLVDSLLGNLQTKIFHANGDPNTNQWAADVIAKNWQTNISASSSQQSGRDLIPDLRSGNNQSTTVNHMLEYEVLPKHFTTLRKGGSAARGVVDGIVFQGGRVWNASGRTYLPARFIQQ